jgi:hypothetical protein
VGTWVQVPRPRTKVGHHVNLVSVDEVDEIVLKTGPMYQAVGILRTVPARGIRNKGGNRRMLG